MRSLPHSPAETEVLEPSSDIAAILIDKFLAYASEVGFFLHPTRFRSSALRFETPNTRPAPAVLFAVYLWGLHLSRNPRLAVREPSILAHTLELTANSLRGDHPNKIMHTLQAHILLAYYFFSSGRFLEGKYHAMAAVSLYLSSGLHLIRSKRYPDAAAAALPAPRDAIEENERIHACWATLVLDKLWAVALDSDAHQNVDGSLYELDTPWPLEIEDYERGRIAHKASSENTLHEFLEGRSTGSLAGPSSFALLSKATILVHRANRLARQATSDMPPSSIAAFQTSFVAHDALIDAFRASLPSPQSLHPPTPTKLRMLLLTHCLVHAATLQLHGIPALRVNNASSRRKCFAAAKTIVEIMLALPQGLEGNLDYLNAIIGTVWTSAFQTLIEEFNALRAAGESTTAATSLLQRGFEAIRPFNAACALLDYQISAIERALAVVCGRGNAEQSTAWMGAAG
ncbi:hypothetical protein HMN09_00123800 [Mycena chlorophos]|uniref:Xylanolytic transcriptional activator regulatory domain-containing protein n=1 Tax=Mycena chlorophos TaxID=658473 RepID=A0A8H6WLW0_MYCCL|nr:hypothetical protein HMN09_00123800 [Mycena chlorophos]